LTSPLKRGLFKSWDEIFVLGEVNFNSIVFEMHTNNKLKEESIKLAIQKHPYRKLSVGKDAVLFCIKGCVYNRWESIEIKSKKTLTLNPHYILKPPRF